MWSTRWRWHNWKFSIIVHPTFSSIDVQISVSEWFYISVDIVSEGGRSMVFWDFTEIWKIQRKIAYSAFKLVLFSYHKHIFFSSFLSESMCNCLKNDYHTAIVEDLLQVSNWKICFTNVLRIWQLWIKQFVLIWISEIFPTLTRDSSICFIFGGDWSHGEDDYLLVFSLKFTDIDDLFNNCSILYILRTKIS